MKSTKIIKKAEVMSKSKMRKSIGDEFYTKSDKVAKTGVRIGSTKMSDSKGKTFFGQKGAMAKTPAGNQSVGDFGLKKRNAKVSE